MCLMGRESCAIDDHGFGPDIHDQGFSPEIGDQGFGPEIDDHGFSPDIDDHGFDPEIDDHCFGHGGEACRVCSKRRLGRPEILLHDPVWGRQAGHWLKFSTSNHVASVYTSRAHILPPVQGCRHLSRPANGPGASTALWSKRPEAGNASRTTARIDPHHSFIPG